MCLICICICISAVVMRCFSVCLSVCVSVTFVDHVKTNKDVFEIFSLSDSHTILVFRHQTGWRYSDGNPPNGGVECRWGRQKSRYSLRSRAYNFKLASYYDDRNFIDRLLFETVQT